MTYTYYFAVENWKLKYKWWKNWFREQNTAITLKADFILGTK